MDIFLKSISGILVILGMILVGFVIGEKGWFDDKSRGLIAKLVTQVALPCYMLYTITQRFTAADLLKMLPALRFACPVYGYFAWNSDSSSQNICSETRPSRPLYFHVF